MLDFQSFDYNGNLAILTNFHAAEHRDIIIKAFNYARDKHKGQLRNSGEPYDQHPISVALELNRIQADYETICAALLHDVIEDCDISKEEIEREFSPTIAKLVDGVTKVSVTDYRNREIKDIQTINKLVLSIDDDVRIIIIKLFDRLHNMRTIEGHNSEEKRCRIAKQTLDVYVPIAALLGLYQVKEELEEICFKTLKKEEYEEVRNLRFETLDNNPNVNKALRNLEYPYSETSLQKYIEGYEFDDDMVKAVLDVLPENQREMFKNRYCHIHLSDVRLVYKSFYGIYKKLCNNENRIDIAQITDLITFRLTSREEIVEQLYTIMGMVNKKYRVINDGIRDYVSNSKTELFKGLLTYNTFETNNGKLLIHFQHQTPKMARMSVLGVASFWDFDDLEKVKDMQTFLESMPIYSDLSDLCNGYKNEEYTYQEFFDKVNRIIFSKRIYINIPDYDFIQTHAGATLEEFIIKKDGVIDLNKIYLVNGKKQSGKYILQNNDFVDSADKKENIITNIFGGRQRRREK